MPHDTPIRLPRRAMLAFLPLLTACGPTYLQPLTAASRGRAILLRGLLNVFSTGMNVLNANLRQANFDASVHNHVEWRRLAEGVAQADRAGTLVRPLAIMGHSYGADDAIVMANWLGQRGVATDLLVTFDPTEGDPIGPGARRVLNFWQAGDPTFRRTVAGGPGFTGTLANQLVDGDSHISIDKDARLHAQVLELMETLAAARPAPAVTATAPPPPRPPATPVAARALPRPPPPPPVRARR